MIKLRLAGCCQRSALCIRLPLAEHLPDDGRQFSHHGHAGDGAAASAFDPFVPLPQSSILPQRLVRSLRQKPPADVAASFGDSSKSLVVFSAVTTAGC